MDINEQFESLLENTTETSEAVSRTGSSGTIDFDELERKPRISIKYWEKLFKGKAEEVFDGIHGYIVFIRVSSVQKRHQSTTFEYLTKGQIIVGLSLMTNTLRLDSNEQSTIKASYRGRVSKSS